VGNSPRVSAKQVLRVNTSCAWNEDGRTCLNTIEKKDGECGEVLGDLADEIAVVTNELEILLAEDFWVDRDIGSVLSEVDDSDTKTPKPAPVASINKLPPNGCEEPPTCLICFEPFEEDTMVPSCSKCEFYVFSSAMKKNKKFRIPCKCQEEKECPDYVHQQCLLTWQNKMAKTTCPLCRQLLYDPRTIFREAFLSNTDLQNTFLSRPVKQEWGVVQCVIRAVPEFGSTRLIMYSEESGSALLEARRTSTSSFISPEYGIFANDEKVASLTSNMMGTTWCLKSQENEDLLGIQYTINRAWLKEPRKMRLIAPGITDKGEQVIHHHPHSQRGTLANMLSSSSEIPFGLELFQNRFPNWNEEMGAFCLNFGGRVRLASVKNFQIMYGSEHPQNTESETLMQFGRVERDVFHMDVQFPFSPLQAFAACVSSFYGKLAVE
jgi:hypothetical protein